MPLLHRILGKLMREMSFNTVRNVIDGALIEEGR